MTTAVSVVELSPPVMSRVLNAIVAVCPDLGIGMNGDLPWHPVRLKYVGHVFVCFTKSFQLLVSLKLTRTTKTVGCFEAVCVF